MDTVTVLNNTDSMLNIRTRKLRDVANAVGPTDPELARHIDVAANAIADASRSVERALRYLTRKANT